MQWGTMSFVTRGNWGDYFLVLPSWLGCGGRVVSGGCVKVLASKKSTSKVGTTVHTIAHTTVFGKFGIGKVCENCRKLVTNRIGRLAARSMDDVVREKNAVLGATHSRAFAAPRKHGGTCGIVRGRGVGTLVVVNKSNSLAKTHVFTRRCSIAYVKLPNAVSGSLCNASFAVKCSATLGAVIRYISGVESATASRSHVFFIRMVKHSTNFLTRGDTVTSNTRTTVVPRSEASISRLRAFVKHKFEGAGGDDVMVIARDPRGGGKNTVCCTSQMGGRCPKCSIEISVLNRLRQNNAPDTGSHVLTDQLNRTTVRTLVRSRQGIVVNVQGGRVICIPFIRTVGGSGAVSGDLVQILGRLSVWGDHRRIEDYSLGVKSYRGSSCYQCYGHRFRITRTANRVKLRYDQCCNKSFHFPNPSYFQSYRCRGVNKRQYRFSTIHSKAKLFIRRVSGYKRCNCHYRYRCYV